MARPIKTFTIDEATSITRKLWLKSMSADWYAFEKNLRITEVIGISKRDQLTKIGQDAKEALNVLENMLDKSLLPAALRTWINTYISADGWRRLEAARRQRKSTNKNSTQNTITKLDRTASNDFNYLANTQGLTKKAYLNLLASWMNNSDEGRLAAQSFAQSLTTNRKKH